MILGMLRGAVLHEIRFFMLLVPLTVVLAAVSISANGTQRRRFAFVAKGLSVVCCLSVLVGLPLSGTAMFDSSIADFSGPQPRLILMGAGSSGLDWPTERRIASDLDQLNLPAGSVLVDDFMGFSIVVSSNRPTQFVITSDRDFQSVLANPNGTDVRYILVPKPGGLGSLDAVNRQYPNFYETGSGIATLVREYPAAGVNDTTWRLYRLT
jgi:hypothetical protein